MKAPRFWQEAPGWRSLALSPVSALYAVIANQRLNQAPTGRTQIPVICVGNFTLGGAGKTPTVLYLARKFREAGHHPAILSRGYGGRLKGPVLVDLTRHDAGDVGDEPALLAKDFPVIIGADRVASAHLAEKHGASILIMDDGLQNPKLARDIKLAVVDGEVGIGNACVFPAGPLRASLSAQMKLIDGLLVIGGGEVAEPVMKLAAAHGRPVFRGMLVPDIASNRFAGLRALAFCGIGRPDKFRRSLEAVGVNIVKFFAFADHHVLTKVQIDDLLRQAIQEGLALITTAKDQTRLMGDAYGRKILAGLVNVAGIDLVIAQDDQFMSWLTKPFAPAVANPPS